jgi:membrane protein DedA with SNARE-associated domain
MATLDLFVRHGYLILGLVVLAEQLGLPVPSMPVLLAMGAFAGDGKYGFAAALALASAASLVADGLWYALGAFRGNSVLSLLCRISLEPDSCVSQTWYWFRRLGSWALVVAKFVPGLSTVAPPMAGLTKMPVWKFLLADGTGGVLWASAFLGLGFAFHTQLNEVADAALRMGSWLVTILGGLLALWILYKYVQRRRFLHTLRGLRITPEELQAALPEFVLIDLRMAEDVAANGKLPGARWFDKRELAEHNQEIPRDRDVVLYCS